MEQVKWKAVIIFLGLVVLAIFSRDIVQFFTVVITEFVDSSIAAIRGGLSGRRDIESVVRFCITVLMIIGVIKILTKKDNE